ncbi:MAG: hypothetical protein KJ587_20165 [Alphaproteobacteria bacterium]|nr:hypothetical protein [Alphaproteobacteria bacterium]
MSQECILGRLDITTANYKVEFVEDPLGVPSVEDTNIAVGNYYPKNDLVADDILGLVVAAMNIAGAYTYTFVISTTTGLITITTPDGVFQLYTGAGYEDSVFLELGFAATDPASTLIGGLHTLVATKPPTGTIFWKSRRDQPERALDSFEIPNMVGVSQRGPTGKVVSISVGDFSTRELTFRAIDLSDANGGIARVLACITEHWGKQKVHRVYSDRVLNGTNYFAAKWTESQRTKPFRPTRMGPGFPYYEFTFEYIYYDES